MNKFSPLHRQGAAFSSSSFAKQALKAPLDFRSGPPKPHQWSNHFHKQSELSRSHANLSTALPKSLPKPSTAGGFGDGRHLRSADLSKATRGVNTAIKAQDRILAHQENVKRSLERSLRAVEAPRFASKFPSTAAPVADVNRRLAETIAHTNAVREAAKAGAAHLKRHQRALDSSRPLHDKPGSGPLFSNQSQLHRTQATLLARVGKAFSDLFKWASPSARKTENVMRPAGAAVHSAKPPSGARKGGANGIQRGAQQRHDAPAHGRPTREPFDPQPVLLASDVRARRMFQAGQRRYEAGDYAGARGHWQTALDLAEPSQRAVLQYNIALTHLRLGDATRVEEIAFDLMRNGRADLVGRLQQLRAGGAPASRESQPIGLGSDAQARRLFEAGQRLYDGRNYSGARRHWNTALEMADPGARPILRFDIGLTHLRQGNTARVEEVAAELIRDGHADLARQLQQMRTGRGTPPVARPQIVGPDAQARRLFQAGQRRYDARDYGGARRLWNTALEMAEPAHRPGLRYNIGLTHQRQGDTTRAQEIAAELMRDGHTDLAGQLRPPTARQAPAGQPAGSNQSAPQPSRPAGAGTRGGADRRSSASRRDRDHEAEPDLFIPRPDGTPSLVPVGVQDIGHVAATSTFVVRFNQQLSPDQARQYLWPNGTPTGAGFVAAADPMTPDSELSAIYHAQIRAPGWQGLRPSVHQRFDALVPGTASVLERRLGTVDPHVRARILEFEDRASPSHPLAEAWPAADSRYVYYFDGSHLDVYAFEPPEAGAARLAREAFEQFRRDMVFLVTRRGMNVRDAWSFLVRAYREELVTVVSAFASSLAAATGPGPAPGRTALASGSRRVPRPPSRQTASTRAVGGGSRATPVTFRDVRRALREHPERVSLNSAPVRESPVNATHQERWERAGGQGPAPPFFRVGDQYHVDRRGPHEQVGAVQAALHRRLNVGLSGTRPAAPPVPSSWRDVQDRLGANPHAVSTSDSRTIHQRHWQEVGGAGPAPAIFGFGEDQVRVSVDSLTRAQRIELRSLLR